MFGGGGYVAGPMVYAAWRKRIPAALAEADAHLGLANRLAAPFARRVFLAYPVAGGAGRSTGWSAGPMPAREPVPRAEARRRFGLPADGPVLLVFGGSQGAAALNEIALDGFGAEGPAVLHLCGERYCAGLEGPCLAARLPAARRGRTTSARRSTRRDLVLARAGGSVWEVAAAGKPAVLVPSPNVTADHQTKNARLFRAGGRRGRRRRSRRSRGCPDVVRALLADGAGSRRWARRCARRRSRTPQTRSRRS